MHHTEKEVSSWNLGRGSALIRSVYRTAELRDTTCGKIIMTSGGFDCIHPGHMTSFLDIKRKFEGEMRASSDTPILIVVVNGDDFLSNKKGRPFIDLKTRCQIVSCCKGVDVVVPFEIEDDATVVKAIRAIKPDIFAKGGDRTDLHNIPEWDICKELGVEIVTGMGEDKFWSSSDFLKKWSKPDRDYIKNLENITCSTGNGNDI